jgi:hypothetical protein
MSMIVANEIKNHSLENDAVYVLADIKNLGLVLSSKM